MARIRSLASGASLLTLAALIGVGTALAAFVWASGVGATNATVAELPGGPLVSVVAARDAIPAGTKLTANILEVRRVPQRDALQGTADKIDVVVGRTLRYPLSGGEQVIEPKLVAKTADVGQGLAFSVPDGFRAMSVPVTEVSGAGGLIVPGDRVDIMVSTVYDRLFGPGSAAPEKDAGKPIVMTVLQDMLVLAVGQVVTDPIEGGRDPNTLRPAGAAAQPAAATVTFAVQPAQAQALFLASGQGALGLVLRQYGDGAQASLEPAVKLEVAGAGTIRQVSR